MLKFSRVRNCKLPQVEIDTLSFDWAIVHALDPEPHPALSLDEVISWAESYNEQFKHENSSFETDPAKVALTLIRLCEVGMVKIAEFQ